LAVAVTLLALVAPSASDANMSREVTVAKGTWHGLNWKVAASTDHGGFYCIAYTIGRGAEDGRGCGSIRDRNSYGISYGAGTDRGSPVLVYGPVFASARSVRITFYDRPAILRPAIAPPRRLDPETRFFVAMLPCPATPKTFVARDGRGRIVARLAVRRAGWPDFSCR
jgi:hypothetical protein